MRFLAAISLFVLAMTLAQPVAAQNFRPSYVAGIDAHLKNDYPTALRHWRPLAEKGDTRAMGRLGNVYRFGKKGVTKDLKEAVRWIRKGAELGVTGAQATLGEMYRDGHGVVQDLVMAYVWMNVSAAKSSHAWTGKQRDKVLTRLNASERRLAVKLSKLCFKKPKSCPEYSDD